MPSPRPPALRPCRSPLLPPSIAALPSPVGPPSSTARGHPSPWLCPFPCRQLCRFTPPSLPRSLPAKPPARARALGSCLHRSSASPSPSPHRLALSPLLLLASFAAASYSRSSTARLVVASPLPSIADPPPFTGAVRGRLVMAALRRATRPRPDFARSGVAPASARTLMGFRPLPANARAPAARFAC
nr:WAS/WASL-interacting protein family member 3-like [Aegilops tauschii subsp. strangulata]